MVSHFTHTNKMVTIRLPYKCNIESKEYHCILKDLIYFLYPLASNMNVQEHKFTTNHYFTVLFNRNTARSKETGFFHFNCLNFKLKSLIKVFYYVHDHYDRIYGYVGMLIKYFVR